MLHVDETIGDYRILSLLSRGGMATLYLGRKLDAPEGTPPAAIKVIHEDLSQDWQFVRMFIDEALISVRLRHPNVVRVDELGEHESRYFLVMEYVHGCSLAQLLRALGKEGRRMRPEIALWIGAQVARGLHAAHEMKGDDGQLINVIHRDVSPQNVLLAADGSVKVLDFGIAKAAGRAERTEAGVIKGKVRYMAPEQARGDELDRRVDIYALAVVLWETLTMRRFIEGKTEVEIIRKVRSPQAVPPSFRAQGLDPRIDDAVLAGLALDPARRPPTAEAFAQLLENALPNARVGASHLAELLRVFVGDELRESALQLPSGLAEELAAQASSIKALPGEDESTTLRMSDQRRTQSLTVDAPRVSLDEVTSHREGKEEPTKAAVPARVDEGRATAPAPAPKAAVPAKIDEGRPTSPGPAPVEAEPDFPALPSFGEGEEEATMQASGHELAQFLARIRHDAASSGAGPLASEQSPPTPPAPLPAILDAPGSWQPVSHVPLDGPFVERHDRPPPDPPARTTAPGRSATRWIFRALLITFVAFALGASFAVAWVRLLS